ncbi:RNA 2',3'-cyclic phosphodiesterase [Altererythrobacter sp. SALINAS58]|uniref:RNA 2',3'-cyclic phosphodiesterase n=1 Tax=Alteripontixanthobacter muriae TaxID=2705546 RepID=UPI00157640EE|nr:RNA 2',3'-cyclic phosphodiesterase [Alteripontixanthobacter muriae]
MHRIFIGIRPPPPTRDLLIDTMDGVDAARWQDEDQLHLTLRFAGECETPQANDLADALTNVTMPAFELQIAGTGFFTRKGAVRALWAGLAPSPELHRLQHKVERVCQSVGLPPETRKSTPHITLARMNTMSGDAAEWLARWGNLRSSPFTVDAMTLFESHLRDAGSAYETVLKISLPGETGSEAPFDEADFEQSGATQAGSVR